MKKLSNIFKLLSLVFLLVPQLASAQDQLNTITSLDWDAKTFNAKLEESTYYDNNNWYHVGAGRTLQSITSNNVEYKAFKWKDGQAIVVKLDAGVYTIESIYGKDKNTDLGLKICAGSISGTEVASGLSENTISRHTFSGITLTEPTLLYFTGNSSSEFYLCNIQITRTGDASQTTAPNLNTLNINNGEQNYNPFLWYATDGLSDNQYGNGNQTFRKVNAGKGTSTNKVVINGVERNAYDFASDEAIAFKVPANTPYRVKVYVYDTNTPGDVLFKGNALETAVQQTAQVKYDVKNNEGNSTNTYLLTYDFTTGSTEETYWIKSPTSNTLVLGGFEVLPTHTAGRNGTMPGIYPLLESWNTGNAGRNASNATNANNTDESFSTLGSGSTEYAFIYGPSMTYNTGVTIDGKSTVMLNDGNRIGFRVPANTTVTIPFIGSDNSKLKVVNGNDFTSGTATELSPSNGNGTYELTTTAATSLWLTSNDSEYVYVSGINATINYMPINGNYIWYASGTLAQNNFTDATSGNYYTFHTGAKLDAPGTTQVSLSKKNNDISGYDFKDHSLSFKVASTFNGYINVYYNGGTVTLTKGTTPQTPLHTYTLPNGTMAVYQCTGGDDLFTISGSGDGCTLGGFEVMNHNDYSVSNDYQTLISTAHSWNTGSTGKSDIINAKDGTTKGNYIVTSTSLQRSYRGATRTRGNDQTIMLNDNIGLGFKLPANKKVTVTLSLSGLAGSTIKLIKGETLKDFNNTSTPILTWVNTEEQNRNTAQPAQTFITGDAESVYWITGDATNPGWLYSYDIKVSDPVDVETITDDYIWVSDGTAIGADGVFGSQYLYSVDGAKTADTSAKITVNGATDKSTYDFSSSSLQIQVNPSNTAAEIRVHFYGTADTDLLTLRQGSETADPIAAYSDQNLNGVRQYKLEGGKLLSYTIPANSINTPTNFYVSGGKIAGVEVLVNNNTTTYSKDNLVGCTISPINWYPEIATDDLSGTITDKNAHVIINGNRYKTVESNKVQYYQGGDLVLNDKTLPLKLGDGTTVNAKTVLLDNRHAIGIKLQGGNNYEIRARWDETDSGKSLRIFRNDEFGTYFNSPDPSVFKDYYSSKDAPFYVNLTSKPSDYTETVWISGNADEPVYFAGFVVKMMGYLEFDTNVTGIFTGKYKRSGDIDDKLLVYCTDNGSYENFTVPKVMYVTADGATKTDITANTNTTVDLTQSVTPSTFQDYEEGGFIDQMTGKWAETAPRGTNNNTLSIDAQNYKIVGFEDTDNDKIYRVIYTYKVDGSEVSDYYYLWFANYTKIGWWVNRDAKLIVGSNDSSKDPENIIVGEFYVSSGSTGNFLYDVINPYYWTDGSNNPRDNSFLRAEVTTTQDDGTSKTVTYNYDPNDTKKGQGFTVEKVVGENTEKHEPYSHTKMNDHKDETGRAVMLQDSESAHSKTVRLKAVRKGWPDWTAKITFHFIKAPTLSSTVASNGESATVTMTKASDNTSDIFYTTDGTFPTVNVTTGTTPTYTATNGTEKYSSGVTIKYPANFYAAQVKEVDRAFYVVNPYTTYIENKKISDLMATTNQSTYFTAISEEHSVKLNDPKVEYLNKDSNKNYWFVKMSDYTATSPTEIKVNNNKVSALVEGGTLYSYPGGASSRKMMMLFGNKDVYCYRQSIFQYVGAKWVDGTPGDFHSYLDWQNYEYMTNGDNYKPTGATSSQNGNPQTECNGGIGGAKTENGGMFLQPIAGDFYRFEPEYDGIVTLWIRQNGAAQSDESCGNITRRPVYVVDENGVVLKRSTVKPSSEHYFGINGTYGEINGVKADLRQDARIDWINGLSCWNTGYEERKFPNDSKDDPLPLRYKATFRLFNYWYGFQLYQNFNKSGHTNSNVSTDAKYFKYSMDVADSWLSRTAKVQSTVCPYNNLLYRSDALYNLEKSSLKYTDHEGVERTLTYSEDFAKYGYEMPSFNVVRYRFPVKAGKSYYIGGRGTKNGFMAVKFDTMAKNYDSDNFKHTDNCTISESSITDATKISTGNATNYSNYSESTALATYDTNVDYTLDESDQTVPTLPTASNWTTRNTMSGKTCNVQVKRTFYVNNWHPIVLPFSVSETRLKEMFGDKVSVLYLDPYDNTLYDVNGNIGDDGDFASAVYPAITSRKLRFTHHHYQMLYANTPAFIRPNGKLPNGTNFTTLSNPIFYRVTIDGTNLGSNGYNGDIGYKIGQVGDYDYYVIGTYKCVSAGTQANPREMYYMDNTWTGSTYDTYSGTSVYYSQYGVAMKSTRCWIEARYVENRETAPARPQGAPRLTEIGFSMFDDTEYEVGVHESGIQDIVMDDTVIDMYNDDNVYDTMGRIVGHGSLDGLYPGIYIFHGQKHYIR